MTELMMFFNSMTWPGVAALSICVGGIVAVVFIFFYFLNQQ